MKKNTKIVDPVNYPDYGENINDINKKSCKKPCKKKDEAMEIVAVEINWGWQIDGILLAMLANILLGVATIIAIFLRK